MSPLDATGAFRHNHESANMHSEAAGKKYEPGEKGGKEEATDHTQVHAHGDGTFHTVDPEHGEVQHESIGHMHAHLSKVHGEEGHSHFHAHHDGAMTTSHSVKAGEEPEHREHEDMQGAHDHMDEAMGAEDHEEPDGDEAKPEHAGSGLGGLY